MRGVEDSTLSSVGLPESETPKGLCRIFRCLPGSKEVEVCMELPACLLIPAGMDLLPAAWPVNMPWVLLRLGEVGLQILEGGGFSGSCSFSLGLTTVSFGLTVTSLELAKSLGLRTASLGLTTVLA